jgi:uncharacterized protein YeaO (DUF488 family)
VLVDRIWPRGIKKEEAKIDLWLKDIAPTDDLRKWFGHDPEKWEGFETRYFQQLDRNRESLERITEKLKKETVTLLYGAKN